MKYFILTLVLLTGCSQPRWSVPTVPDLRQGSSESVESLVDAPAQAPMDQYKSVIVKWATRVTGIAVLMLLGGAAAIAARLPFSKDLLSVGCILLLGSGALAMFVTYASYIIGVTLVGFALYIGYLMFTRVREAQIQTELVESAEYLKYAPDWNDTVKGLLRKIQSSATKKIVDKVQAQEW